MRLLGQTAGGNVFRTFVRVCCILSWVTAVDTRLGHLVSAAVTQLLKLHNEQRPKTHPGPRFSFMYVNFVVQFSREQTKVVRSHENENVPQQLSRRTRAQDI